MAPYGACEVAQSTARSKAQFEAERFWNGIRRKSKHDRKCFEGKRSMLESASEGTKKHARAVLSSAQWPQSTLEQWFRALSGLEGKRSMLEHWFRALSRLQTLQKASSSSDFERPVATEHARAVTSSALCENTAPVRFFECCRGSLEWSPPDSSGEPTY